MPSSAPLAPTPRGSGETTPDPSVRTTENLLRELAHEKEYAEALINFVKEISESKVSASKEVLSARIQHLDDLIKQHPDDVVKAILHVTQLADEKFKVQDKQFENVQVQFKERDTRDESKTRDSVKAIDAAFQSADKAITKTENAVAVQIQEQGKRIDAVMTALTAKNDDLKERVTIIESLTRGMQMQKTDNTQSNFNTANLLGIVFGALGAIMGIGSLIVLINKH